MKTACNSPAKSKEEVLTAIRDCAEKLGHSPSYPSLKKMKGITHVDFRKNFGTYTRALRAAGIEPRGGGHMIGLEHLFKDWAEVVRSVKKAPSLSEYELHSKYSARPLMRRYGVWGNVPRGLREFAERNGLEKKYADVMLLIAEQERNRVAVKRTRVARSEDGSPLTQKPKLLQDRPVYGPPLGPASITNGPVNESGVIFLFGMLAARLGFVVMRIQAEFPDCEAMREVEPGRWQRVRIEFEFESRRFLAHKHGAKDCDVIVCWLHNWAECPGHLEVIELQSVIRQIG
jgi:hypothetical protein